MCLLSLIVAVARNRVIGRGNAMPWRIPEETAHFKRTTMGHPVIMGRKTFESIGKVLPGRRNIVVTRQADWNFSGTERAASLEEACALCGGGQEAFLIGGAALYREGLELAQRLIVTEINRDFEGDTFFPEIPASFRETSRESHHSATDPSLSYDYVIYQR